jgi:hypothetical protein
MRSWLVALGVILLLPLASAETIVSGNTDFEISLLIPLFLAIIAAIVLRRWMVPQQLSSLQVGFEIDDDLYEVHRLTNNRDDAKELLSLPGVRFSLALYMMAMTAILLLITELFFNPNVFYLPNVVLIGILFLIPVFISPWESLNIQLSGKKVQGRGKNRIKGLLLRLITLSILISATLATIFYGTLQGVPSDMPIWYAVAILVFMGPTILAYGRIMGASWNMLVIGKWRTIIGRKNPIDPDRVGFVGRIFSIILFIFLLTMPFTAINGIVTVFHVMVNSPENSADILNYGGIIGHELYLLVQNHAIFSQIEYLKTLPQVLSVYLSINIAVVGLAFIFELLRNLYLGGQTFGGLGGVMLATPREIRTEEAAQSKVLYFAFAGFSGYTALLLFLVCYKEFGDLMPYTDWLEQRGFKEEVRLLATWMFIAVGQAIFLLTWVLSIARFGHLRRLQFDLNPDQRREGAVMSGGSDWMRDTVDQAALAGDIDALIRFQAKEFEEDPALVRHEKARAKMLESGLRGLWPRAIEEARKVLAQAGGDDDEARMVIAVGHLASRRLDAARESLHNLQQPEGYDEPELLSFILEWMDPWHGAVDEDDLWDWENNPCIDHLHNMMRMLRDWSPNPSDDSIHHDALTQSAILSQVALLRAQNLHEDALRLALETVKNNPLGARPRIAVALCLLDSGEWHSALSILSELEISDEFDPRVKALANIMGKDISSDQLEVSLTKPSHKRSKNLIDEAPVNPVAGLMVKGGIDEALNANVMIAASESVAMRMTPIYTTGILSFVINWLLLTPTWLLIGIASTTELGTFQGVAIGGSLIFFHQGYRRLRKQQRKVIKHRDQKGMIAYAKRLKRHKIDLKMTNIPVGTHLLMSGLLVTVNGVVFDVGFPGWMVDRLPKSSEKGLKQRFSRRHKNSKRAKDARKQNLSNGWWLKRPKEAGSDVPALERLIGPVAYRGRSQMIQRKTGRLLRSHSKKSGRQPMSQIGQMKQQIPMNTIRSERKGPPPKR